MYFLLSYFFFMKQPWAWQDQHERPNEFMTEKDIQEYIL